MTADMPIYLSCGRLPCSLPCGGYTTAISGLGMILREGSFVPSSIFVVVKGTGMAWGAAEIVPQSLLLKCLRLAVEVHAHAQAERYRHRQGTGFHKRE